MLVPKRPVWPSADARLVASDAIGLVRCRQLDGHAATVDWTHFVLASVSPATLRLIAATFVDAAIFDEISVTFAATPGGMVPDTERRQAVGR